MIDLDWRRADSPAEVLRALDAHRLLPVAGLLSERGLLRADLVPVAEQMAARRIDESRRRGAVEEEVVAALAGAGVDALVLKGALLARTVYPEPARRFRQDLDVLVPRHAVEAAQAALRGIDFVPSYDAHGGPPMTQKQWIRHSDRPLHAVDLHWDLSNRPLLKDRFGFARLMSRRQILSAGQRGAWGLADTDAFLHAAAHYFGHHRGEFRPDQWLLDMDLLWRAMGDDARDEIGEAAVELGIASLVAEALSLCRDRFATPFDQQWHSRLSARGRGESAARLIRPPGWRGFEMLRSAFEERGTPAKIRHLRGALFPPAVYMRRKYPGSARWALPWLYLRRMWEGRHKR